MTDKEKKEEILKKAYELANKAELVKDKLPKSTLIAVAVDMAEWCYSNIMEEHVSEEQVKESAEIQHVSRTCKENGNSLTQEPVSEDLKEAIEQYCVKHGCISIVNGYYTLQEQVSDIARHFANWQKQQMMAKAVDGKIYETQARSKLKAATIGKISGFDYRVGDKVKVIIFKDE